MEIVVILGIAIAWGAMYFRASERTKRELRRVPRVSLGALPDGQRARIVGIAQVLDRHLEAPLTGRACVYYVTTVDGRRDRDDSWHPLLREERSVPFAVDDGTGRAIVDPDHATVALDIDSEGSSLRETDARAIALFERHDVNNAATFHKELRYCEAVIEVGEQIAVLGKGVREPDPAAQPTGGYRGDPPTLVRMTSSAQFPLVISDNPRTTR
jgi:E3 Ubiquitin ligase